MTSLDSFKCQKTLKVGGKTYVYYSLPAAEKNGLEGISKLPYSMKVLLENLLRNEDDRTVRGRRSAVAKWLKKRASSTKSRSAGAVLMQDFQQHLHGIRELGNSLQTILLGGRQAVVT